MLIIIFAKTLLKTTTMRKSILKFLTIFMLSLAVVSCKNNSEASVSNEVTKAVNTSVAETSMPKALIPAESAVKYMANPQNTLIEWTGSKPTGKQHFGTLFLNSGEFTINDGKVDSGLFIINMSTIKDYDGSTRLEGHLKSADFFDVENHPNATFEVTSFKEADGKMILSGNLEIKGKKNNIAFPVTLSEKDGIYTITSEKFTIDRSKWNVRYGSNSFFDNLGDKLINNDIEFKIIVNAKKLKSKKILILNATLIRVAFLISYYFIVKTFISHT